MSLFLSVLGADLKDRFTRISTYIYFALFLLISFLLALSAAGVFENVQIQFSGSSRVFINSPYSIQLTFAIISFFSVFLIAPIFGQNAFKDYLFGFDEITYSRSFSRTAYFLARYLSAVVVSLFILSSIAVGFFLGTLYPEIDPAYLGASSVYAYVYPYIFIIIPNVLIFGGLFYLMGSFFKKMAYVYLSGAVVFMGWMLSGRLGRDVETYMLGALVDPSGIKATGLVAKYWTAAQQNEVFVPLESYLLYNRIMWVAIGLLALVVARIYFERKPSKSSKMKIKKKVEISLVGRAYSKLNFVKEKTFNLSGFLTLVKHEFMQSIKHPVVLTLLFLGVGYMLILSPQIGKIMGTPTLPVTYTVIEMLGGVFSLFVLIIITFWSGEMIWKESSHHMDEIVDSSPASITFLRLPKLLALNLLIAVLMLTIVITGVLIQSAKGYYDFRIGLYLQYLFLVQFPIYFVMTCMAFFLHSASNNKFIGHAGMIIYYIYLQFGNSFGIERNIFLMGSTPSMKYSDMNGFGPNVYGHFIFTLTWMSLAFVLVVLSLLFFQRGKNSGFQIRLNQVASIFSKPLKAVALVSLIAFVSLWSFSYYNTSVLNEFTSSKEQTLKQVDYEKTYREKWLYAPRPDFIDVKWKFDLYPSERKAVSSMKAKIKNTFSNPIEEALVSVNSNGEYRLEIEGGYKIVRKEEDYLLIKFNEPLLPAEVIDLSYDVTILNQGFENSETDTGIVKNGSFMGSWTVMPSFGYNKGFEVSDRKMRRRYDLGEHIRSLDPSKPISSKYTYLSGDALRVSFESVVSTSGDQTIVTPGYLVEKWQKDGRNYFKYRMNKPILKFFSVLSARYEIARDKWNDVDLEVFYTKGHEKNVETMLSSVKDSLDYFSKNFSPYQYKQFRIFEFPRYASFAQAFPNTIPFSEDLGFIADFQDDDSVDYAYYITSHELAHQWFGHQLAGGGVPGATMLVESLAQYGAVMAMKHRDKENNNVDKYLKYEMDRYLNGRATEVKEEMPLAMGEDQGYIHYRKAASIFYRLQEEIGEQKLNLVIRNFIKKYGFDSNPEKLPQASMFVDAIKIAAPEKTGLIDELFNQIILYENRVVKAEKTKLDSGAFEVKIDLSLKKIKASPDGKEDYIDFEEEIPVGLRDKEGKLIYYKRHNFSQGEKSITVRVDQEPFKASVDPMNSFIDKSLKDNEVSI